MPVPPSGRHLSLFAVALCVAAAPADLELRNESNPSGNNLSPKIWAPVLGVIVLLFALCVWRCSGRGFLQGILTGIAAPEGFIPPPTQTRELTAEQLAGSINRNAPTGNNNATGGRSRRARRARRTPSQMSTTSLPAYMKEPGEQELVLFRGPEDLQDVPLQPVALVMPSVDEDGEENAPRMYPPMPNSPADMPFLQENDSVGQDATNDTPDSPDPRGEAPSYDEAVGISVLHSPPLSQVSLNDPASPPSTPEEPQTRRMSGFRSIFNRNRLSHASPANDLSLGHIRSNSDNSIASSVSRSRNHHPNTFFRTLSRQRSIRTINSNHLTSPSVVSINSISPPLTHTVIRTEITYPRAGPTPEQIRLISSPDALTRFGVPYGADAIAFAASTSQQALEPPPDFDAVSPPTNLVSGTRSPPLPPVTSPTLPETSQPTVVQRTELEVIPQTPIEEDDEPTSSIAINIDRNNLSISSKRSVLPPSSFHSPTTELGVRAESRVSSYTMQSYATASESISANQAQAQDTMGSSPTRA